MNVSSTRSSADDDNALIELVAVIERFAVIERVAVIELVEIPRTRPR